MWPVILLLLTSRALSLQFVSFDLDDTLWPTAPVVQASNAALEAALAAAGAPGVDSAAMQVRIKRCRGESDGLTYSELRTRAIETFLSEAGAPKADADRLFGVWLEARHAAAEQQVYEDAIPTLRALRQTQAVIGAVTNSRANPLEMPSLRDLFDFCVSGEDGDVFPHRKPSPQIFAVARRRAAEQAGFKGDVSHWVHVGDDLINDVDASKRAGAFAVWFDDPRHQGDASFTSKSARERAERAQRAADILAQGRVDARITCLADLLDIVGGGPSQG